MSTVIATHSLTKNYKDVQAVSELELDVRRGEIYAFLGRNGAGKTTTIRMLLGMIRPTRGEVHVLGRRIVPGEKDVFARVGYLVETATSYPNLTVAENLRIQARLTASPPSSVPDIIARTQLSAYEHRRAGRLSLGNKQRLALARALLHHPELLILDEPANGLDPAGIVEIRELLHDLAVEDGVTVFMSSHILAEVAHLADRIAIVHEGRLIEEIDRAQLQARARSYLHLRVNDARRAATALVEAGFTQPEAGDDPDTELRVLDPGDRMADIARLLVAAGLDLTALTPVREDLESYFLRATGGIA